MNEVANLSNDINVITAEINSYKQMAGQAIFEIGKRLKHVKENDLQHGEFTNWCEKELNFSYRQANRYIKAHDKFSKMTLGADLSLKKMDLLASFDDEELEKPVKTSSGETKKPTDMTQREIEEYKKKLKEAEQQAEQARRSEEIALRRAERAENKPPEVIEKEVDKTDYQQIERLKKQLDNQRQKENELQGQVSKLKQQAEMSKKDVEEYNELRRQINDLHTQKDDVVRQIESAGTIGKFIARVERSFEEDLAPIKYTRAIREAKDNQAVIDSVESIVVLVEDWTKEIRQALPQNNYIDAEVIDYE